MIAKLPKSIEAYFEADRHGGPDGVAAAFTDDAIVTDVGETHTGHEAIRAWKAAADRKYTCTVDPFFIATENGKTQVTAHVAGNFPGSPIDLRFFFVLAGDKIAGMEITV